MSTQTEHAYTIKVDGAVKWRLSIWSNEHCAYKRCPCARAISWQAFTLLIEVTADAQEPKDETEVTNEEVP